MWSTALAAVVPFLAVPAQAYFILSQDILVTTREDPIVFPGTISQHVHTVAGSSNFNMTEDFASATAGSCTTAPVSIDKSSYWSPQLYYYDPSDASYEMVPVSYMNAYYLPRYTSDSNTTLAAPPQGLRMISGNPYRRTFNASSPWDAAVSFVCLDFTGADHTGDASWDERNDFFTHNCPSGMRAQVNFPNCWDGVNLDSADHQSHMAWPTGGVNGGGECPDTHPVHIVMLFYEFIYEVQNFPFNDSPDPTWVWANGNDLGYGMHGDYIMGWESPDGVNILQQAIDQCNQDSGVGGELENCPPFVPYLQDGSSCRMQNLQIDEDVGDGHKIARLPGDNPLWTGNSTTKPSWGNYSDAGIGLTDFKSAIPAGYTDVGCIAEGTSGRALAGASSSNANMTRGVCVSWCAAQGFPLAGIEYGQECYCDTAMRNGASNTTLLADSECGMACADNANENCGGSSTLELFNNPALYPASDLPAGWADYGCMTEATNARALAGYSTSSSGMTPALCIAACDAKGFTYAGAEYADECYCANSFSAGAVATDADECSMACAGDKLYTCGGSSRLTVWVKEAAAASSSAAASSTTLARRSRHTARAH